MSDLEEDYANSHDSSGDGTPTYNSFSSSKKKEKRRLSRQKTKGVDNQGEVASLSIIELMHQIVSEPSPRLGSQYDEEAQEFVDACLVKDPDERHTFRTLLVCINYVFFVPHRKVLIGLYPRNIDGWMMLEIRILMWQRGRTRFDSRSC